MIVRRTGWSQVRERPDFPSIRLKVIRASFDVLWFCGVSHPQILEETDKELACGGEQDHGLVECQTTALIEEKDIVKEADEGRDVRRRYQALLDWKPRPPEWSV